MGADAMVNFIFLFPHQLAEPGNDAHANERTWLRALAILAAIPVFELQLGYSIGALRREIEVVEQWRVRLGLIATDEAVMIAVQLSERWRRPIVIRRRLT